MPDQPTPAHDARLAAMYEQANRRLGTIYAAAARAVFNADGFPWRPHATQAVIARAFGQIPPDADPVDGIARVICVVYDDHGHPRDPAAVRQAVARQLGDAGPHSDQPGAGTSW